MEQVWGEMSGLEVWGLLVAIPLAILAFPFVVGPFIVRFTLGFRLPVELISVNPRETPLPEDTRQYFDHAYHALVAQGFELLDVMFLPSFVPNVRTLIAVYVNRRTLDSAISSFIIVEGAMSARKRYVEFVRRYTDGTVVQTNNSDELGAFPAKPNEHTTQFTGLEDLARLYSLHQFVARKRGGTQTPYLRIDNEFQGRATDFVARAVIEESLLAQLETKYLEEAPKGMRPTWKGAILMAWRELWPVKPLRRLIRRRAADKVLREFAAQN
jgi:hypothetical protein